MCHRSCTQPVNWWIIQGPPTISTIPTPTSFGTKDRVISWIWLIVWSTATTSPTIRHTARIGPASLRVITIAPARMWTTVVSSMALPPLRAHGQRAHEQPPAVDEHEQQQLEGQRDHDRWQHDHAERHQPRGHHEVDDQERDVDDEADQEGPAQLRQDVRGDEDAGRDIGDRPGPGRPRDVGEQRDVLDLHLPLHIGLQRGIALLRRLRPPDLAAEGRLEG